MVLLLVLTIMQGRPGGGRTAMIAGGPYQACRAASIADIVPGTGLNSVYKLLKITEISVRVPSRPTPARRSPAHTGDSGQQV